MAHKRLGLFRHPGGVQISGTCATHIADGAERGPTTRSFVRTTRLFKWKDDIVVTEDGYENLSDGLPRTVDEIEALMRAESLLQKVRR